MEYLSVRTLPDSSVLIRIWARKDPILTMQSIPILSDDDDDRMIIMVVVMMVVVKVLMRVMVLMMVMVNLVENPHNGTTVASEKEKGNQERIIRETRCRSRQLLE